MTPNVLIIENNKDTYNLMCSLFNELSGRDFNFEWKRDYKGVRELIQNKQFDYCMIDNQMLSRDHSNIFSTISHLPYTMLIIALSGIEKDVVNANIYESNSSDYLIRGQFSKETLLNIIHYAVKNHEMHKNIDIKANGYEKNEGNFLSIANSNLDGLLVLDGNGTVLYSNPAAGALYDCSPQQLIGRQLGIPITNDRVTVLDLIRKDGNTCIVEARFANVDWTNREAFLVSLRDITEQEHLLSSLRKASIYDELTGLYNRREANRLIRDEIEYCKRYSHKSSLIMFDLDGFKEVNDSYGHIAGDNVLRWIGQLITSQVRSVDKVARFGGDEFLVLLPSIPGESALIPSRRICKKIAKEKCSICIDKESHVDLKITISLGITELPTYGDSVNAAINTVDRALYTAKGLGGNCIYLYQPEIDKDN